ncbi:MAG: alpha/beta hydrolase [Chloroflexi bacterium]|nr:alpha/beta hydrolase [Chloroflexota bacterium]
MLFVTNRAITGEPKLIVGRKITLKLEDNQALQSVYFCRRKGKDDYEEVGSENFLTELRDSPYKQILIYLHGYSNLPEDHIFPTTTVLQQLLDAKEAKRILVLPFIWPCDNDIGMIKDYFDDQVAADASGYAFARVFQKFMGWREENNTLEDPCLKRINILAHSMGNRVLRATMDNIIHYYQPTGVPLIFRNIFLAAADVVNETLDSDRAGRFICQSARNVVVYYASDDLALRASKVANLQNQVASRRLGHTGPENMAKVAKNVYAVDCDDFNTLYDNPIGHTYFLTDGQRKPGLVFSHMWGAMATGRVPMDPPTAQTMILTGKSFTKQP